ncbi:zinc finger protein 3 homolog [Thalassophryne amazonica]|uniref:zinc finger protein 3 homolog n=1 Tax=Thalassophryne amazonica TaxID=390379 RepID=UPI0014715EBB|nr:zinc finger protein 3 homolog [Thalassophryne amazonica]
MAKVQMLRALINQRLTAAAEEIFGLFEKAMLEYGEELCRATMLTDRQRPLQDTFRHKVCLNTTDMQQILVSREDVPPEQQQWSPSLDQEQPLLPHIKEEQEELCISPNGQQHQKLEESDAMFTFTPLSVKWESEEYPGYSEPLPNQTQSRETSSSVEQTKRATDGGSGPATNSQTLGDVVSDSAEFQTDIDDNDWRSSNTLRSNDVIIPDMTYRAGDKPFSCSQCAKRFAYKEYLKRHMKCHMGEKPFSCYICGQGFTQNGSLKCHMRGHTGERPFSCSVCMKRFGRSGTLRRHMKTHTGEKPFCCSVCGYCFTLKAHLTRHMAIHTRKKTYR